MIFGMNELQALYSLWMEGKGEKRENFAVSFSAKEHKGPLILCGLSQLKKRLGEKVFSSKEIAYLHSLCRSDGKLVFPDTFIHMLENLSYDVEVWAPYEGTIIFSSEPMMKISGSSFALTLFKKEIEYYLIRQIQIATEIEKIVSFISPAQVVVTNSSISYECESVLDTKSAYTGGAVASEDLHAAIKYNIPLCHRLEKDSIRVLDVSSKSYFKELSALSPEEKVFLQGGITREFLEDFPMHSTSISGVKVSVRDLQLDTLQVKYHSYQKTGVLDPLFQCYRFSHKGLYIGDILSSSVNLLEKKMIFGVTASKVTRKVLLHNLLDHLEEDLEALRNRVIAGIRLLPCKYRGGSEDLVYPVRIMKSSSPKEESVSKTKLA